MTDERYELTRRKILATAGAVGAAGAGAGLGTSAFFSDEDSFANNQLVAGEVDLKVDWEEHYSYPQIYEEDGEEEEFDDPTVDDNGNELDVTRSKPSSSAEYVGLPDPNDPVLWVHEVDLDAYMDNTAIEAYPDDGEDGTENDGIQDDLSGYDPCTDFADLDEGLDPSESLRTDNADTRLDNDNDNPAPLINLTDIKPGDFGEVTLSFHLCDNPGYVWLRAANILENENKHFGNDGDFANNGDTGGELGEKARALVWYDSGEDGWNGDDEEDDEEGDNVYQQSEETVIERGSLREVLKTLTTGDGFPLEGDLAAEKGGGTGRNCFDNSTTYQIGFAWWLPEDVGNEVAADSIQFDLGFYTEQCRHNNGVSLSSGLTGYWPLDSVGDGTAEDLSGNGYDGTVVGDVTSVDGKVGDAASFGGRSDYINIDGFINASAVQSRFAWIRPTGGSGGPYPRVIHQNNNLELAWQQNNEEWAVWDGNNWYTFATAPTGTWQHVGVVWDGSSLIGYKNGQPFNLASNGGTSSTDTITIGANPSSGGDRIRGEIDDVRIYSRALSSQEVQDLYDATK